MVTVSSNIHRLLTGQQIIEYLLDGDDLRNSGASLYIEAGTTVRGAEGQGPRCIWIVVNTRI